VALTPVGLAGADEDDLLTPARYVAVTGRCARGRAIRGADVDDGLAARARAASPATRKFEPAASAIAPGDLPARAGVGAVAAARVRVEVGPQARRRVAGQVLSPNQAGSSSRYTTARSSNASSNSSSRPGRVPASRLGEARHRAEKIVVSEDILLAPNRERTAAETAERRRLD